MNEYIVMYDEAVERAIAGDSARGAVHHAAARTKPLPLPAVITD